MKVSGKTTKEFDIDKVICDIDVRYYVDCSFSKDNGETWEKDFEDDDESDDYVKSQLPCMKDVTYKKRGIWSGIETTQTRKDWCPVIDVNEGKILDWTPGFCLNTGFKVCDQGVYVYSNQDESQQIVSCDCDEYYVPKWLDEIDDGYGDYMYISINGDGTIKDWDKLKKKLLKYVENYLDFDKVKSNVNIEEYVS
jgi:hypothetical protein